MNKRDYENSLIQFSFSGGVKCNFCSTGINSLHSPQRDQPVVKEKRQAPKVVKKQTVKEKLQEKSYKKADEKPISKVEAKPNEIAKKDENFEAKKSNKGLISLENFEVTEAKNVLNSPRSLEAWRIEGIDPKELLYVPKSKFKEPGVPKEITELRYEFHESKRKELLEIAKKARLELIDDLDSSVYDHPTLAGSTLYQTQEGTFQSKRSATTSKSARSKLSSQLLGGAMDRDKEVTQKQMELIRRLKEKEQKNALKIVFNEERKNRIIEEKEARFEQLRQQKRREEIELARKLKADNEKKMMEEIAQEKAEQQREKKEK